MRPLSLLWTLIETPGSAIGVENDVRLEGARRALVEATLLRTVSTAQSVACTSCGVEHLEEVHYRDRAGVKQPFISCPSDGNVAVSPERLLRWAPDLVGLTDALARSLEAAGERAELFPERLWHLGRMTLGSRITDLFFLRGFYWDDGSAVLRGSERFDAASDRILLIPRRVASVSGRVELNALVVLDECSELRGGAILLDRNALVAPSRPPPSAGVRSIPAPQGTSWKDVRLLLGKESVSVTVGGVRWRKSLQEAGFASAKRRGSENPSWTLLNLLATKRSISRPSDSRSRAALAERVHEAWREQEHDDLVLAVGLAAWLFEKGRDGYVLYLEEELERMRKEKAG